MSKDDRINVFDDIQSLCKGFRRHLKQGEGERKRIEDFLDSVGESSQEMLFQNLLLIEVEFRRRQNQAPSSDEYVARFPQFARLVRQAFFESTMMSREMLGDTPADEPTVVLSMPAARKLGEYELLRELGRGGFGVVYEARHLQRGDHVALKTLPCGMDGQSKSPRDAERLYKFRQEFRSLSEVNHPNLVGMQTLEMDADQWFFTMDLVEGVDFLDYVRPNGRLHEKRLRSSLSQLVRGIVALHKRGIVHRDLKPSNVMVAANGHVVILDFGLVAELQQPTDQTVSMQTKHFAGTPRYAAPEQAVGKRTTATDWYAVGVMVYEALTGEAPLKGSGVELILKKQNEDAPELSGNVELPEDLAALVDELLQRAPERRPEAKEIASVLGITVDSSRRDSTDSSLVTVAGSSDMILIGRESQLATLESARQELLETRQPVVAFISGRSGEGKTSLAEKFLAESRRTHQMLVLSGRCYDRESVPFKAIDSLIDALVAFLRARTIDEVLRLLPADVHMLAQLFPVLRRVEAIADRGTQSVAGIDSREIRYRAFAAMRELLAAISKSSPVILFVDDLQWGDADSATALSELLLPPDPPAVMLLGSYRSDEASESPFLKEWQQRNTRADRLLKQLTVEVSALTEEQCIALAATRLGQDSDALRACASEVFHAAEGNPYILEQLIEAFDLATGQFQAVPLVTIIDSKLKRLPSEAVSLLEAVAVAGQAVSLAEAASVAQQSSQAFATITHMRSERMVRLIGSSQQQLVDTYHDKIRETVLGRMQPSERRGIHVRFGELIEQQEDATASATLQLLEQDAASSEAVPATTNRIFDIAYHFHAAQDARAFAYQLMAGEQSFQAYASEDSLEFLKRAEANLPSDASDAIRYRLWERLASSHARLCMFEPAFQYYDHAIQCAPSHLARATAHLGVARCYQSQGRYASATASYDRVLEEIGTRRPTTLEAIFGCVALATRVFLKPARWQHAQDKNEITLAALEEDVYIDLSHYLFEQDLPPIHYVHSLFKQAVLAFRTGRAERVARGLSYLGSHLAQAAFPGVGQRLLKRSLKLAKNLDDVKTEGLYGTSVAVVNANCREAVLADTQFRRSLPLLEKCGVHNSVSVANHLYRHLLAVIGTSSAELETAEGVLRLAEEVGDVRGQYWGHYDMASAYARAGEIDVAKNQIEQSKACLGGSRMHLSEGIFLATHGYVLLQASEYEAACEVLEESWRATKRRKILMDFVVRAVPLLIEGIAGADWLKPAQQSQAKRLKQLCRMAWLMHWFYPNLQSPIERARGRAFCQLGKRKTARRCFERAVKYAANLGADYDHARSLLDLAAIKEDGREESRRKAIELLIKQESVIPYAERWLLGEQYDASLVAPPPDGDCSNVAEIESREC